VSSLAHLWLHVFDEAVTCIAEVRGQIDTSGGEDACHPWTGSTGKKLNDYGRVRFMGTTIIVTRIVYTLTHGPIADELVVRHSCDNRRCCNVKHLSTGTQADNVHDTISRGRYRHRTLVGEQVGTAKLTDVKVRDIRARLKAGVLPSVLAREYGVSKATISMVRRRRRWRHA